MQSKPTLIEKYRQILARDPKRSAVLGGLAVIMLVLWGRVLLNGPARATASLIRRSVAAITDSSTPAVHQTGSNAVLDWLAQPKRAVQRNFFAINLDYYSRATDKTKLAEGDQAPDPLATSAADQARQQKILQENLQTQASKLKLQTTLMGTTPRAMVNGELVKEGDIVEGFRVIKILARKIILRQDNVELEIEMP